jgi:hypothetical protein
MYLPEMLGLDQEICSSNFQKQSTYMKRSETCCSRGTYFHDTLSKVTQSGLNDYEKICIYPVILENFK